MRRRHVKKDNILLVNITRLGDMMQATPTIAGMKMENPDAKITVLVEKQFEEICTLLPNIDEVVGLDLGMTVRSLAREGEGVIDAFEYVSEVVDNLKSKQYDYCLNMSSSGYTALMLNLLGVPRRGGWASDEEGHRIIESDWARLFATSVFHFNRVYNSLNLVDIFRCSADVEQHPEKLLITVTDENTAYAEKMVADFGFTNTGPLIAVQAGASQGKRQWAPEHFVAFIKVLIEKHNARIVLTGSKKELSIIDRIVAGCNSPNVGIAAGRTSLGQLAALLKLSKVLVTGDTGPMHVSVAAGTPVVAMFLASAYGFETGPYSEGNLVLQPVIGCGPCNPNKGCARTDCHDTIDPKMMAALTMLRVQGDVKTLPAGFADPNQIIVYRTHFDQFGFYNMQPLNNPPRTRADQYREAYRKLWLDDIADLRDQDPKIPASKALKVVDPAFEGVARIQALAERGAGLIQELTRCIRDPRVPATSLRQANDQLTAVDVEIEQVGYHYPELGPLARMFIFAKENISGTEAEGLASQMGVIYGDLSRRSTKLTQFFQHVS